MASRPLAGPYSVITNGDMSDDITSSITLIPNISMVSYDVSWSGTAPVGVLAVQVSNTYEENADGSERTAGNWTSVTTSNVSGDTGGVFFDIDQIAAYAIRLVFTFTSGTGSLQAKIAAKVA